VPVDRRHPVELLGTAQGLPCALAVVERQVPELAACVEATEAARHDGLDFTATAGDQNQMDRRAP